jgi:hypothetical protein
MLDRLSAAPTHLDAFSIPKDCCARDAEFPATISRQTCRVMLEKTARGQNRSDARKYELHHLFWTAGRIAGVGLPSQPAIEMDARTGCDWAVGYRHCGCSFSSASTSRAGRAIHEIRMPPVWPPVFRPSLSVLLRGAKVLLSGWKQDGCSGWNSRVEDAKKQKLLNGCASAGNL